MGLREGPRSPLEWGGESPPTPLQIFSIWISFSSVLHSFSLRFPSCEQVLDKKTGRDFFLKLLVALCRPVLTYFAPRFHSPCTEMRDPGRSEFENSPPLERLTFVRTKMCDFL